MRHAENSSEILARPARTNVSRRGFTEVKLPQIKSMTLRFKNSSFKAGMPLGGRLKKINN
jgi:hypothetical protein